jgi:gentisate 1,2-dioxygenase
MDGQASLRKDADDFARYYARLSKVNMAPLWEVMRNLVTPEPVTPTVPAHWRYAEVRPLLFESAAMISAEQAERRVLVLENPGLPGQSSITHSLYAGIQLVMPGEIAPQHRHTQSALRFILEGNGATTTVDGERFEMYPGDLILTPSWQWHDHQNETKEPIVWMDGLDIALVGLLDASFSQNSNRKEQEVTRIKETSQTRYGGNLLPIDDSSASLNSPLMRYPYADARATLERMKAASSLDPNHGIRMRYAHPRTGDWVMPTMGAAIQLIPKGFTTAPYRATDGAIFAVAEGRGTVTIGEKNFALSPHDVFVCPAWAWRKFSAQDDLVLFTFSDRPVQEKIGLWREERGAAE